MLTSNKLLRLTTVTQPDTLSFSGYNILMWLPAAMKH